MKRKREKGQNPLKGPPVQLGQSLLAMADLSFVVAVADLCNRSD